MEMIKIEIVKIIKNRNREHDKINLLPVFVMSKK